MSAAVCRYCGAPIVWVLTTAGRRMPIDPEPNPDGNLAVRQGRAGLLARLIDSPNLLDADPDKLAPGELRCMPHFATCPNRPKRKPRG